MFCALYDYLMDLSLHFKDSNIPAEPYQIETAEMGLFYGKQL